MKMSQRTHMRPFREFACAGDWQLCLATGVTCPFCDRIIRARDAEIADAVGDGFRIVCPHCHRDVLQVKHVSRNRDDDREPAS
jgi:hypothetical protein